MVGVDCLPVTWFACRFAPRKPTAGYTAATQPSVRRRGFILVNWEAAGAIGEIVGALAVVVSLLYLSVQLRNQNRESRAAGMHEIWSGFRDSVSVLGESQAATIYTKALAQEELTDSEQMQLLVIIQNILRVFEEAHMQWKQGRLDDDVWESMLLQITLVLGSRPFRFVWELRKEVFGSSFQEFIENLPRNQYSIRETPVPNSSKS